ncbi:MAG: SPOR domain-containing protein [Bdellovibrio sp.]|nr:SPOR domain-containing protein [Bdellovibrio sp.]
MTEKPKFYIYARQEMKIVIFLSIAVIFFAFTLGVHLGKRISPKGTFSSPKDPTAVKALSDVTPDRNEIIEQTQGVSETSEEEVHQALQEEIKETGLRLEKSRQVDLPAKVSIKKMQHTYTLQIGSFPDQKTANEKLDQLKNSGISPVLKEVNLKGKGKWYRLYIGEFTSADKAKEAGLEYKSKKIIENFVVANLEK